MDGSAVTWLIFKYYVDFVLPLQLARCPSNKQLCCYRINNEILCRISVIVIIDIQFFTTLPLESTNDWGTVRLLEFWRLHVSYSTKVEISIWSFISRREHKFCPIWSKQNCWQLVGLTGELVHIDCIGQCQFANNNF